MIRPVNLALLLGLLASPALAGDFDLLPYLSGKGRKEVAADFAQAGAANQPAYTVAIAPIGSWDSLYDASISPEERARNVLQRCEHRSRVKCLLAVQGGKPTGEKIPRVSGLVYARTVNIATIPFVPQDVLNRIVPRLLKAAPHRAMAINAQGFVGIAIGSPTPQEAGQLAVANCNVRATKAACVLYAVDDTVVFNRDAKISEPVPAPSVPPSADTPVVLPPAGAVPPAGAPPVAAPPAAAPAR